MLMQLVNKLDAAGQAGLVMADLSQEEQTYLRHLAAGVGVEADHAFRHELFKSVKVGERAVLQQGMREVLRSAYDKELDQMRDRLPAILNSFLGSGADHVTWGQVVGTGELRRLYFTKEHLDDVVERHLHGGKRIMGFRVVDSSAPGPHVYVFKRDMA